MRFTGPFLLCVLALAAGTAFARTGAVAASADPGPLADTLNSPIPADPSFPGEPPQAKPLTPQTRAQAREAIRRARAEERGRILEDRLSRRRAAGSVRDSVRRLGNFTIGAGLSIHGLVFEKPGDTVDTETSPGVGLTMGYRSHMAPKLGMKTLLHYRTGFTMVERAYESGNLAYQDRETGIKGTTSGFDALAQVILGPLGRFAVEPGIAYAFGWHSAESIPLDLYGTGRDAYRPLPRFTVVSAVMGATLYLGRYDHINPTGYISVGKVIGHDGIAVSMNAAFSMAFRED